MPVTGSVKLPSPTMASWMVSDWEWAMTVSPVLSSARFDAAAPTLTVQVMSGAMEWIYSPI